MHGTAYPVLGGVAHGCVCEVQTTRGLGCVQDGKADIDKATPVGGARQEFVFSEGMPESQPDVRRGRWKAYRSAAEVQELLPWLHSNGVREQPLRKRLQAVHAGMAAVTAEKGEGAVADEAGRVGERADGEIAGGGVDGASGPRELGEMMLQMEGSLPSNATLPAAAGSSRRDAWRALVSAATGVPLAEGGREGSQEVAPRSQAAMAALLLLEGMLRVPWLRPFWRLWSLPLPLPERTATWAAVWHRALHLRAALRVGRSVPSARELAAFAPRPSARAAQAAAASESNSEDAPPEASVPAPGQRRRMALDLDLSVIDYSGRGRRCRSGRVNYAEAAGECGASSGSSGDAAPRRGRDTRAQRAARRWADRDDDGPPRRAGGRTTRAAARAEEEDALGLSGRELRALRRGRSEGRGARGRRAAQQSSDEDDGSDGEQQSDGEDGAQPGSSRGEDAEAGEEARAGEDGSSGGGPRRDAAGKPSELVRGSSSDDDDDFGKAPPRAARKREAHDEVEDCAHEKSKKRPRR